MNRYWSVFVGGLLFLLLGSSCPAAAESPQAELTVTASVQGQGFVSPPVFKVSPGGTAQFVALADFGWQLDSVSGDTCEPFLDGSGSWSVSNVQADCLVLFEFTEQPLSDAEFCSEPDFLIPDNNPDGIDDFLIVDVDGEIVELRVELQGLHTWVGDLRSTLTHPDQGTEVVLLDRPGVPASSFGCSGRDFDLVLSDDGVDGAVNDQCNGTPPALFGNPVPEQPLDAFAGLAMGGVWVLNISDNAFDDIGRLQRWCLTVSYLPEASFVVTPSAGSGGAIIPDTPQTVPGGNSLSFEVRPDEGFEIDEVGGSCGGSLDGEIFTTAAVLADCTVQASFAALSYQVTALTGQGQGSVSPAQQTVSHGDTALVSVVPDPGWRIEDVRGDSCTPQPIGGGQFQAEQIVADCLITVDFELITHTVTPSTQGGGGSISPDDPQTVLDGDTVDFQLTPSNGFLVDEVNSSCGGSLSGLIFSTAPVFADCEVVARFRFVETFTVTPLVEGPGGSIEPGTPQQVESGASLEFELIAEPGFVLDQLGGSCEGQLDDNRFVTAPVSADCTVEVSFRLLVDEVFEDRFEILP